MSRTILLTMIAGLWAVGLLTSVSDGSSPAKLADMDLPLTVGDSAGVERKSDICSTGVPLPLGLLKEPEGVAVFDEKGTAIPAQFRVLERWRNFDEDKSVKWLLVTFLADVPKDGKAVYHLKAGKNPAPAKPVKIEEKGDAYEMGGQVFKKDFSSPFKLVLTDPDGKEFTAADVPVTWSIWENGPVRACLKAESPTVPDKFGFIAWIYAFAGQDGSTPLTAGRWDMTVVLKNTPRTLRGPFFFKDFSVIWAPAELKGAKDYIFGGEEGKTVSGQLAGPSAYLYQASDGSDKWNDPKMYAESALHYGLRGGMPEFRGYKVFDGDKELGAGDIALGWVALNGGGRGAVACTRAFHPQYPKVAEVEPGKIIVRLWPKQWKPHNGLHWLDDMQRKAYDVSFRLTPKPVTAREGEDAAKSLECFLVAGAPMAAYRGRAYQPSPIYVHEAEVPLKRETPWTAVSDWVAYGSKNGPNYFRYWYNGGGLDGYARSLSNKEAYGLAVMARMESGMVPMWLDDYQYPRDAKELQQGQYCAPVRQRYPYPGYRPGTSFHNWCAFNHAHFFCGAIFDGWRLLGDPLALDAAKGLGVYFQSYVDLREGPKWKENIPRPWTSLENSACNASWEGGCATPAGSRAEGTAFHNLCHAYFVTGDETMMNSLRRLAAVSWRQVDKERGVYAPSKDDESYARPFKSLIAEDPAMLGQVMDGLITYYNLTHDETTLDEITGLLDWIIAEGTAGKYGHLYHVELKNPEVYAFRMKAYLDAVKSGYRWQIDPVIYSFVYENTGDKRYRDEWNNLQEGRKELNAKMDAYLCALHYRPETKFDIFDDPRKGHAPDAVSDLAAESLGDGKVKLTWTAPKGEPARYQVKWSEKKIVERLNFDRDKRVFEFDPKDHASWWAANNVEGEPTPKPGVAGAKESMTVEGVTPGKSFFAIRSFDAASNRSAMSNLATSGG